MLWLICTRKLRPASRCSGSFPLLQSFERSLTPHVERRDRTHGRPPKLVALDWARQSWAGPSELLIARSFERRVVCILLCERSLGCSIQLLVARPTFSRLTLNTLWRAYIGLEPTLNLRIAGIWAWLDANCHKALRNSFS